MPRIRYVGLGALVCFGLTFLATIPAHAQSGEVSFNIGGLYADELQTIEQGVLNVARSWKNKPLIGARGGWYGFPIGVEGAILYTQSGLAASIFDGLLTADARAVFIELNAVVNPVRGNYQPFFSIGFGNHTFELNDIPGAVVNRLGYNFGGGMRIAYRKLGLRFNIYDHVTSLDIDDLGLNLDEIIESQDRFTIHNVEFSAGVGVRF